jgi:hypothetical protein
MDLGFVRAVPRIMEGFHSLRTGHVTDPRVDLTAETAPCEGPLCLIVKRKNRPLRAGGPTCLDSRLTDGGKVVSPTHRPRSTPQKHYFSAFGPHFC